MKRRWFIALMGCGCIVGGLLAALVFYLPGHIEQRILPRLAAAAGFDPGQLEIRRVGLTGADIGPIQLRLNDAPCIDIPAIQINYSIVGLFRRSIDDVIISGMQLTLSLNHDATGITGLTPTGAHSAHAAPVGLETLLPFEMKRVQLRNALITLQ
ncbi:MAG: hypothetical protein HKP58_18710, partial [Desulfatitalea sp.]|nr:hypothetical protein [Desulfatitalea sp.]NNK02448.1 hypothetical protein [Desulfatitalea sp.]